MRDHLLKPDRGTEACLQWAGIPRPFFQIHIIYKFHLLFPIQESGKTGSVNPSRKRFIELTLWWTAATLPYWKSSLMYCNSWHRSYPASLAITLIESSRAILCSLEGAVFLRNKCSLFFLLLLLVLSLDRSAWYKIIY